ncbi:MAG: hypothetical protein ACRYHQ_32040 [Janthinobacterium lividum]
MARRPWTPTEAAEVQRMKHAGASVRVIAAHLGRTPRSVEGHIAALPARSVPRRPRRTNDQLAGLEAVSIAAFLAIPTPRGIGGRLTWRGAA